MTELEINETVAKKLGWIINKTSDYLPWYGRPNGPPESAMIRELPDYCRDIKAAWEIVEKFKGMGLFQTDAGHWYCVSSFNLSEKSSDEWYFRAEDNEYGMLANTAPLAICLAFLKLP